MQSADNQHRERNAVGNGLEAKTAPTQPGDHDGVKPIKLAHVVLRTSQFEKLVAWYKFVLNCNAVFENELLSFLTYDEEHHRIAILNVPDLGEQPEAVAGVHHIAFTFASMADLMAQYSRLRDEDIKPVFVINHGPTTSMYYCDPDGNQLEFQIENYDSVEESTRFFYSEEFAENPIGVEFDPEDMLAKLAAGVPEAELKRRPRAGAKGLDDIKLR